jgi:PAS domain S-box-containing protein
MLQRDPEELFEACPDGVAILDTGSGTILRTNERCAKFSGRSREALAGTPVEALTPDDWRPATPLDTLIERAQTEPITFDWRIERPDGGVVDLRCSMRSPQDTRNQALVTIRTHQGANHRTVQRQLQRREERFRRLFEDHSAPMLLVDPETGEIERANAAAADFYGYDEPTLTSMTIQEINQLSDEEIARLREEADSEETNRFIFPHELANGDVREVEVDSSPIHAGGKRLLFSIIHDVTEREANRRRLERQNEQLEVLNRVVRHDIRNDMTVVTSYADLLTEYVEGDGEEYLDTVRKHTRHAVELTTTVRDLMAAMLDDDATQAGEITLPRCLEAELDDARSGYDDAEFTVDGSLPDVPVVGNEMLSSVFRNLLSNAVQHNDKETPEVTVTAEQGNEEVVVRIADNGPGIPDAQKADIFGKGEHGMDSSGTGLGLYLVHTFVDQFDGEVWVTDNEPAGAVFHVALPKADS